MKLAESKLTSQGQISVPAEIRKKLGVGPGAVLEWVEQGGQVMVRKAGRHTSLAVHSLLFGDDAKGLPPVDTVDIKDGIRKYARRRYARD